MYNSVLSRACHCGMAQKLTKFTLQFCCLGHLGTVKALLFQPLFLHMLPTEESQNKMVSVVGENGNKKHHVKNWNPFCTVCCWSTRSTKRINTVFGKKKESGRQRKEVSIWGTAQWPESKEKETIAATEGQYNEPKSKISKWHLQVPGQRSIDDLIWSTEMSPWKLLMETFCPSE